MIHVMLRNFIPWIAVTVSAPLSKLKIDLAFVYAEKHNSIFCEIVCRLYDSNGAVSGSGSCFASTSFFISAQRSSCVVTRKNNQTLSVELSDKSEWPIPDFFYFQLLKRRQMLLLEVTEGIDLAVRKLNRWNFRKFYRKMSEGQSVKSSIVMKWTLTIEWYEKREWKLLCPISNRRKHGGHLTRVVRIRPKFLCVPGFPLFTCKVDFAMQSFKQIN